MSQQINLFNPIFLKQSKYFSTVAMAQALGLMVLGLGLVSGYSSYQVTGLEKQAHATMEQLAQMESELAKLEAEFKSRQKDPVLEGKVKAVETEVQSLQKVSDLFQKGEFGNTKGYSEYFRAFSRQISDGIWLTGLSLYGAGNEIGLQGRALQPELVPAYITRLGSETIMQGKSFATLEMKTQKMEEPAPKVNNEKQREPTPPGYIEFNLQSAGMGKELMESAGVKTK